MTNNNNNKLLIYKFNIAILAIVISQFIILFITTILLLRFKILHKGLDIFNIPLFAFLLIFILAINIALIVIGIILIIKHQSVNSTNKWFILANGIIACANLGFWLLFLLVPELAALIAIIELGLSAGNIVLSSILINRYHSDQK